MKFFRVFWLWMFLSEFKITVGFSGYTGGHVVITCSHSWASSNIKYFCRDPCGDGDILVRSDRSPEGRFTLRDYGTGIFTVNITDLQESDSGIYKCGVQRVGIDTYQRVSLTVSKDNTKIVEELTHFRTTETETNPWTAEIHPTTPRHSVYIFSTTKESTHSLRSTASGSTGKKTVPVHFILYATAGLLAVLIISSVGLVTYQWRKRVKTSRYVTDRSIYNERQSEEAIGVYGNAPDHGLYTTTKKSRLQSKDKSQSDHIYQNLHFNTSQEEAIYGNL